MARSNAVQPAAGGGMRFGTGGAQTGAIQELAGTGWRQERGLEGDLDHPDAETGSFRPDASVRWQHVNAGPNAGPGRAASRQVGDANAPRLVRDSTRPATSTPVVGNGGRVTGGRDQDGARATRRADNRPADARGAGQ